MWKFSWLVLAVLSVPLRAEELPPGVLIGAHFDDFSQGLYDTVDPKSLPPNASPDTINVLVDEPQGSVKPRNGFVHCGALPSGNPARSLYEYQRSNGSRYLIASDNGTIYQTPDCVTWTTVVSGLSTTGKTYFETARDKLWMVNRSTWVQTWDGTTRIPLDGRANTPVPTPVQCNYLKYFKNRMFCARTEANPSGIAFTALYETTAGNELDPSTGTLSWPAANLIQVNRDSGGPLYGIYVYGNRLFAFKEREIWNVDFVDDLNISLIKTESQVGTRYQSSIVEKDGYLYFVGPDGFYKFDGNRSVRISDNILFYFSNINQATANLQRKIWDADADFDDGTFNGLVGVSVANAVSLSSITFEDNFADGDLTGAPAWTQSAGNNFSIVSGQMYNSAGSGTAYASNLVSTGSFSFDAGITPVDGYTNITKFFQNGTSFDNSPGYAIKLTKNGNGVDVILERYPSAVLISSKPAHVPANGGDAVNSYRVKRDTNGNFQVYEAGNLILTGTDNTYNTATQVMVNCSNGNCTWDNFNFYRYADSGTWTSEDYNMVTVTTFSTYGAESVANGGIIGYEVRVATNSGGLTYATYSSIVPGTIINGTTNQVRIQTRVTLTGSSTDKSMTPYVTIVSINWYRSGSPTQLVESGVWKNRLWVAASTGTSNTTNIVFVNSKYDDRVWIPYTMSVGAMVNYSDNFYAAASTHSGVYRMDYGSNDNGVPITWYWTTRDETWGDPYKIKYLWEMQADFKRETASNFLMRWSRDQGTSYSSRTIDLSGSGYDTTRQFINGGSARAFRFQVGSATLDERAIVDRFSAYARISRFRE